MSPKKILIPLAVLALAGVGAFLLLATAPEVENVATEKTLPIVRTIDVQPGDVVMRVRSQGTVAPRTESDLIPEVSGRVEWMSPSLVSGGFFMKDEPLLRVDRRDYEAALASARADVARAEGEARHARAELKRQEGLARSSATSTSQLSNARRAARVANASLEAAKVGLEVAERDLARTEIVAPYDGRVRTEQVDVGQFVSRGMPVAKLYATDHAEIRLPLADKQLAYLDLPGLHSAAGDEGPGPEVVLRAQFAGAERTWTGRIVRTEGEIDAQSRMVHVVARVSDPYGVKARAENERQAEDTAADDAAIAAATTIDSQEVKVTSIEALPDAIERAEEDDTRTFPLAVGLFVRAEIEGRVAHGVLIVPRASMRDGERLLVVDGQSRLREREGEILRIDRDDVLVRTKLEPGDRVVVSPLQVVVDGMRVRPQPTSLAGRS